LFGVLPVAIERDVLIACAAQRRGNALREPVGRVFLENLCANFPGCEFSPMLVSSEEGEQSRRVWRLDIDTSRLRWDSYVKAAYYVSAHNNFVDPSATGANLIFCRAFSVVILTPKIQQ